MIAATSAPRFASMAGTLHIGRRLTRIVGGVLAYVFWHVAASGVDAADYEARLAAFHAALRRDDRPPGLGLTATVGLEAVPWLDGAAGYEDWYLVDNFAALGVLNAAAVSGGRRAQRRRGDHGARQRPAAARAPGLGGVAGQAGRDGV